MSDGGVHLIDVRSPGEYHERHVEGFENRPLDQLTAEGLEDGKPVAVMCLSGKRASKGAERLSEAGVVDVRVIEGGIKAWEDSGKDVVRGQAVISMERQVRIAAGLLVFIGVALGFFAHPAFLILSAFVGAGLTFAGITDTCGMGMLLSKAPWNRSCAHS